MSKPKKASETTDAAIKAFKAERLRWVLGISQVGVKKIMGSTAPGHFQFNCFLKNHQG